MQLLEHRAPNLLMIKSATVAQVTVGEQVFTHSFAMMPEQMISDWSVDHFAALSTAHLDALLAHQPDVILLGTGSRLRFPAPALRAHAMRTGIGLEVMDTPAAARTYNVLASEGRQVLVAFLFD